MEHNFTKIFDIPALTRICEGFTRFSSMGTALLDLEGNVHIATGWHDICVKFHRMHSTTSSRCKESDTVLAGQLDEGKTYNVYRCKNGLVDVAIPVFIKGEHVGNFFTGQFFFETPDVSYFRNQAHQYGFDEHAYIEALGRVPVLAEEHVKKNMAFLVELTQLIGEMGVERLRTLQSKKLVQIELEKLVIERTSALSKSLAIIQHRDMELQTAQQVAHIGSWSLNITKNRLSWSDETYRIFGIPPETPLTLDNFVAQVHPDDRNLVASAWKAALQGEQYDLEHRILRNGETRWVHEKAEIRLDDDERPVVGYGTVQDITEKKLIADKLKITTEALTKTKTELELIIDNIPGPVFLKDTQNHFMTVNKYIADRYNMSKQALYGRSLFELHTQEDAQKYYNDDLMVIKNGEPILNIEETWDTPTGSCTVLTSKIPIMGGDGAIEEILGISLDISEKKEAEKKLQEQTQRVNVFFNALKDAVFVHPIKEEGFAPFVEVNSIACERYGYSHDEFLQLSVPDIAQRPDSDPQSARSHKRNLLEKGEFVFESVHTKKSGERFPVEISSRIIYEGGKPYGLAVVRDISKRKKNEKEMKKLQIQNWHLKKTESLSRMAGAIAHHFNNHLMGITGNLELSLKLKKQNESIESKISEAIKSAEKAADISGLMLTYLGQNISQKKPIDLGKICRISVPHLKAVFSENMLFVTDYPSRGPMVYGDPNQIQQMVTNLVTNAVESYEEKGTVHLSVKTVHTNELSKQNRFPIDWQIGHSEYACLEVADSGCGIEDQNIDKIFDPFFSTKFTGRGLDLAVVLGIVRAHNGGIAVKSKPGKGSIFQIFLPLANNSIIQKTA